MNTIINDNFFSNSKPNLINNKIKKNMEKLFSNSIKKGGDKQNALSSFYENCIKHNLFAIIIIIVLLLFLICKYKSKNKNKKHKIREEFLPTFNSYYPVNMQNPYVNYLPDTVPQLVGNKYKTYNDIHPPKKYTKKYPPIPNKIREYDLYTGIQNTYKNSKDPVLPNALGLPSNYNTTTEKAMEFMTSKNRENLDNMTNILFTNPSPGNITDEEWNNKYMKPKCYYS
jgi:hypothetical protein